MDELLRAGVPEIKLALGELIDRENAHPLPARYARLLPETHLIVTLRPDAGDAVSAIASGLERELTDSCNRHGSLYDRSYKVQLRRADDPDAPLFAVTAEARPTSEPEAAAAPPVSRPALPSAAPVTVPARGEVATVVGTVGAGWQPNRWLLVVENAQGEDREVFRIEEPVVIVGRRTNDPQHKAAIAISDAPHVSRRQLALRWDPQGAAPGFRVYNLGLNEVHVQGEELPGVHAAKTTLDLAQVPDKHQAWWPPRVPLRIGDQGPTLRIEELPEEETVFTDPDATVFD
jgi:hypothetical protein